MQRKERVSYVNNPQRQTLNNNSESSERRWFQILFLSFGLLCLLQATLNITLRLTAHSECNTSLMDTQTSAPCEPVTVKQRSEHCNDLQERFNALTRERDLLRNQVSELNNQIRALTERDRPHLSRRAVCPDGWGQIQNRCYFLATEKRSWNSSRRHCQSLGADLVVINDEHEQRALYRINSDADLLFWIGLYNDNHGSYRWVDNTPLITFFWKQGQPDHGGPNNVEDCVEMYHRDPVLANWNNAPCWHELQWICEKEA